MKVKPFVRWLACMAAPTVVLLFGSQIGLFKPVDHHARVIQITAWSMMAAAFAFLIFMDHRRTERVRAIVDGIRARGPSGYIDEFGMVHRYTDEERAARQKEATREA
jgi:hypothetical protein